MAAREINVCDALVPLINALSGSSGLPTFVAGRVWSFGFTDGELTGLKVVIRPYETDYETEARYDETNLYQIEIAVAKMVSRLDIAAIDTYFNLITAIADLFPLDYKLTVSSTVTANVVEKRWFPMFVRLATIDGVKTGLDVTGANTRFMSTLILKFREDVTTSTS